VNVPPARTRANLNTTSPLAPRFSGARQPWDLLLICAGGLFLTAVARTHTFVPGLHALRPTLLLAALGLAVWLFNQRGLRSLSALKHPLGYLAVFLAVWAGAGIAFAMYPGRAFGYWVDEFARVIVLFLLIAAAVRNIHDVRRLLAIYAIGTVVYAVFATTPGAFRGIGAGGYDPNDSAMFIVSGLPVVMHFFLRARGTLSRLFFGIGALLACGAIALSGSRGAFLALIALVAYILFFYKAITPALRLGIVVTIAGGIVFTASGDFWERMQSIGDEDDYNRHSVTGRQQLWTRGMGYMFTYPAFGVGLANFSVAEGRHPVIAERIARGQGTRFGVAHSSWVEVGSELGIPGFIAFISLFVISFKNLRRFMKVARQPRAPPLQREGGEMAGALMGSLIGLAVAGTFLSQAYGSMIWGPLALVLGLIKVMRFTGNESEATAVAASGTGTYSSSPRRHWYRPSVLRRVT